MAEIHPQLSSDCIYLGRFPLSHLLLMNDSNYPWYILVPDRDDIREIYQLGDADRAQAELERALENSRRRAIASRYQAKLAALAAQEIGGELTRPASPFDAVRADQQNPE